MDLNKCKVEFLLETVYIKQISDDEYFSNDYKEYVSNSKLKLINPDEGGYPMLFKNGIKSEYNSSFVFGSAVHELLLQPNEFILSEYSFKPAAKLGLAAEYFIKYRKEGLSIEEAIYKASDSADYYKNKLTKKIIKTGISKSLQYYIDATKNNIYSHPSSKKVLVLADKVKTDVKASLRSLDDNIKVYKLLKSQNFTETKEFYNEEAMFIDIAVTLPNDEVVVIPFKLKLDNYSIDHDEKIVTLNDLKTTGKLIAYFMGNMFPVIDEYGKKVGEQFFNGSFQKLHYYRQMAIYMMILQAYCKSVLGLEGYTYKSNMIVVESQGNFNCEVFPVSNAYIKKGLEEFKDLICRVAYYEKYGYDCNIDYDDFE